MDWSLECSVLVGPKVWNVAVVDSATMADSAAEESMTVADSSAAESATVVDSAAEESVVDSSAADTVVKEDCIAIQALHLLH